ncbi:hypothetical protein [Vibrio gangliei]|uniref:hypothetical protein n=1 Tax=Vibrio gangliei TaxID=2077090 RepID=UPI000D01EA1E|nr:hypothetical protein [Vibrio gangliei]
MKIEPVKPEMVTRDENGLWTHSQFPNFDGCEYPTKQQINQWCSENNVKLEWCYFEFDAAEELQDRYFEDEDLTACAEWEPTHEKSGSFLFSIHDTEDGPIAVFAIPTN